MQRLIFGIEASRIEPLFHNPRIASLHDTRFKHPQIKPPTDSPESSAAPNQSDQYAAPDSHKAPVAHSHCANTLPSRTTSPAQAWSSVSPPTVRFSPNRTRLQCDPIPLPPELIVVRKMHAQRRIRPTVIRLRHLVPNDAPRPHLHRPIAAAGVGSMTPTPPRASVRLLGPPTKMSSIRAWARLITGGSVALARKP